MILTHSPSMAAPPPWTPDDEARAVATDLLVAEALRLNSWEPLAALRQMLRQQGASL